MTKTFVKSVEKYLTIFYFERQDLSGKEAINYCTDTFLSVSSIDIMIRARRSLVHGLTIQGEKTHSAGIPTNVLKIGNSLALAAFLGLVENGVEIVCSFYFHQNSFKA